MKRGRPGAIFGLAGGVCFADGLVWAGDAEVGGIRPRGGRSAFAVIRGTAPPWWLLGRIGLAVRVCFYP